MKTTLPFKFAAALLLLTTLNHQLSIAFAQTPVGTTFTYQGRLNEGTNPANGLYDFQFSLSNAPSGGSQVGTTITQTAIGVTNGLFTTTLEFRAVFTGNATWLAISVRTNGVGGYIGLSPLQELTPTPYAIFANTSSNVVGTVAAEQLSGTLGLGQLPSAVVTNTETDVTLSNVTLSGNGGGLTNLNASHLTSGTVPDGELSGNVALLNGNQSFTGSNSFSGLNASLTISGTGPISTSIYTGLGFQFYNSTGEGAIMSSVNDAYASLNFYTKPNPGIPPAKQVKIDRYGTLMIDQQNANYGALNDGTTNSAGLVFGTGGGEGIASQRTAGVNKNGLDFYTSSTRQMSILNNGNIGMGTTNPSTALQVIGTVTATAFSGNASGLTNLNPAQLSGALTLAQLPAAVVTNNNVTSVTLSGTFSGNGAGLTSVNAATLGGLSGATFWKTNGNAGANPTNGAFLGTTDYNPLEIHVDGTRGLRVEPDSRGYGVPTLIGGYAGNAVLQPGSGGDFIGGGGVSPIPNLINSNSSGVFIGAGSGNQVGPNVNDAVLAGGNGNVIQSPDSVVGGGVNNVIRTNAQYAFIGGGYMNTNTAIGGTVGGGAYNYSSGNSYGYSTVSGGQSNSCGSFATVAGGYGNTAGGFGSFIGGGGFATDTGFANNNYDGNTASGQASTIGGGFGNTASGPGSFIGGGGFDGNLDDDLIEGNQARGGGDVIGGGVANEAEGLDSTVSGGDANAAYGDNSVVPGGYFNYAAGNYSFAAGDGATANYDYSFVWSDGSAATEDTGANQFVAQASGGFFFYSSTGTTGAELPHGSGSWSSMSDRSAKNNFAQVAPETVLARVASLPMSTWSYKTEQGVRHIGPMAQDFHAAFGVGEDDKHIADVDEGGVALAAIQGLNQKVEEQLKAKDVEIQDLKQQNDSLAERLNELEATVKQLVAKK